MGTFKDSLKKWFYTNSSSAASKDARIPLLTSTGDPKGSDTMGNLASVLDVMVAGESAGGYTVSDGKPVFNSFVDNFVTPSTHQAWGNGGHGESILEVIKNNPYVIQRLTSSKAVFIRMSPQGGSTWSDWKSISLS